MHCITVPQPWAYMVTHLGETRILNFSQHTTWRGRLLIYAAAGLDGGSGWGRWHPFTPEPPDIAYDAIVGGARLAAVIHTREIAAAAARPGWEWLANDPHVIGPYVWVLEAVHRLEQPRPRRRQAKVVPEGLFVIDEPQAWLASARWIETQPADVAPSEHR